MASLELDVVGQVEPVRRLEPLRELGRVPRQDGGHVQVRRGAEGRAGDVQQLIEEHHAEHPGGEFSSNFKEFLNEAVASTA